MKFTIVLKTKRVRVALWYFMMPWTVLMKPSSGVYLIGPLMIAIFPRQA